MRFRTEIEHTKADFIISHDDCILLLGSCFSDNVGERLKRDGFEVCVNPFGPLYNPATLARLVNAVICNKQYTADDFHHSADGFYHCLDFAMRFRNENADMLADMINNQISNLVEFFEKSTVVCLTFGSSETFRLKGSGEIVGNCHKLNDSIFERCAMSTSEIVDIWSPIFERLKEMRKQVVVTVSPIRHLAYGLHGNQLGKARLLLAIDEMSDKLTYFPAYEIMFDDLRDYRFYSADMKHPSDVACEYIYEKFSETFFTRTTLKKADECRSLALKAAHRPLI